MQLARQDDFSFKAVASITYRQANEKLWEIHSTRVWDELQGKRCSIADGHEVAGPTMDVVEMVLSGRVNKGLVTLIQQAGGRAVGVCGKDSGIINARMVSMR